jgi:ankyrin repeat protein
MPRKGSSSSSSPGKQLLKACISGKSKLDSVRTLLDRGIDVNWRDPDYLSDQTALMLASGYGRNEIVKLLLDRGALIDLQNEDGSTALMMASFDGKIECARLLLERGADTSITDKDGKTAKDDAQRKRHDDIVQLLNVVCLFKLFF